MLLGEKTAESVCSVPRRFRNGWASRRARSARGLNAANFQRSKLADNGAFIGLTLYAGFNSRSRIANEIRWQP